VIRKESSPLSILGSQGEQKRRCQASDKVETPSVEAMDSSMGRHRSAMKESRERKERNYDAVAFEGKAHSAIARTRPVRPDWIRGYQRGSKKKWTIQF
jgi:hypothetical protein